MKMKWLVVGIVMVVGASLVLSAAFADPPTPGEDAHSTESHFGGNVVTAEEAVDDDWRRDQANAESPDQPISIEICTEKHHAEPIFVSGVNPFNEPVIIRIAVCDVAKVQAAYKDGMARSTAWEKAVQQARAKVQGTAAAIAKLQAQLDGMKKKRGEKYEKLVTAIATATANNQAYARVRSKELDAMRLQAQQANREAQERAVEAVAKVHSTELVIPTSIAIYNVPAMDITAEVIEEINKKAE